MQTKTETAKIVAFPVRRRDVARSSIRERQYAPVIMEAGGWYHDEAMRLETVVTTLSPSSNAN